jgi:tetratricopeptide (TPR) repeat protein/acyl carrier protein
MEIMEQAKRNFESENYYKAILNYQKILSKYGQDTTSILNVAACYKMLNDFAEAEIWYGKVLKNGTESSAYLQSFFDYAQVLTINRKYEKALEWYKSYYLIDSLDSRALAGIETIENFSALYYDTTFYAVYPTELNTIYSEFSPVFYKKGVVFVSERNKATVSITDNGKNVNFMKWYYSDLESDESKNSVELFGKKISDITDYNAGSLVFYNDYKNLIFSQNIPHEQIKNGETGIYTIQLYSASINGDGEWSDMRKLDFCDDNYSYGQPAITSDGKSLVFSSDIPGGYGGSDLYISRYKNGIWETPENLGKNINTKSHEMFPYIQNDSILYFSTDGYGGLGGLDICYVNLFHEKTPERFGMPLNSSGDDFGIIFSSDGMSGYFSSSRTSSVGSDDIYAFKIIRISIVLKIIDRETSEPIINASVIKYTGKDEQFIGTTDSIGSIELIVPVSEEVKVKIEKENFDSLVYTLDEQNLKSERTFVLKANKIELAKVYKVQIAAGRRPLSKKKLDERYKGNMEKTKSFEDGWYKYTIGEFTEYDDALKCLEESNVYDAFIPVYLNNRRIKSLFPRRIIKPNK